MNLKVIDHGSEIYEQMIKLRIEVLLQPIGIPASYINRDAEKDDLLIGAFELNELIGCCILTKKNATTVQLRQMAVAKGLQGKGIGAAIVGFAESVAKTKHFTTVILHARSGVADFYLKCGFAIKGETFYEVGIAHRIMEKDLQ